MANALNDASTNLDNIGSRTLITCIGKALVKKNVLSASDIASELSGMIQALEANGNENPDLIAELKHILGAVVTW